MRNSRTFRPAVSSFVTAAISSTLFFATLASAQGRPPAPPRAGVRDTMPAPRPGEPGMMPGMRPGGMARRGGAGTPGMPPGPGARRQRQPLGLQAGGPPSPAELLRLRQELGLTPEQVRRLESMQSELGGVLTPDQRAQVNKLRGAGRGADQGRGVAAGPGMQGPGMMGPGMQGPARQGPGMQGRPGVQGRGMQGRDGRPGRPAVQGRVTPRGRGLATVPRRARGADIAVRRRVEIRQGAQAAARARAAMRRDLRPGRPGMVQGLGPDRRPGMAPDPRRAPRAGMRPGPPPRGGAVMRGPGAARSRPPVDRRGELRDPRDRRDPRDLRDLRDLRDGREARELRLRRGAVMIEQDISAR